MYQLVKSLNGLHVPAGFSRLVYPGFAFLDIETTGLSPYRSRVIAAGVLYLVGGQNVVLEQLFAETPADESHLLRDVAALLSRFPGVVTYNGRHFDLPFLHTRAGYLQVPWPPLAHVDLLPMVQQWKSVHGRLDDCRLRTVLSSFGLSGDKMSSGAAVPTVYRRWLRKQDPADPEWILRHNMDDLIWLPTVASRPASTS